MMEDPYDLNKRLMIEEERRRAALEATRANSEEQTAKTEAKKRKPPRRAAYDRVRLTNDPAPREIKPSNRTIGGTRRLGSVAGGGGTGGGGMGVRITLPNDTTSALQPTNHGVISNTIGRRIKADLMGGNGPEAQERAYRMFGYSSGRKLKSDTPAVHAGVFAAATLGVNNKRRDRWEDSRRAKLLRDDRKFIRDFEF
jgi:hypothetical protein